MSYGTKTTWQCDRCGAQTHVAERGQPAEWRTVRWSHRGVPLEAPDEYYPAFHLCPKCSSDFMEFTGGAELARQEVEA